MEDTFERDVLASMPSLKAYAVSLSGNGERASDLVQETVLRAFANKKSFERGTNLPAWLFTILKNLFRSEYRKRRREVEDAEGSYAKTLKTQPNQVSYMDFEDFKVALDKVPPDQREALILVGASGFSYEDAAVICGCAVGTIKSRVNRARCRLMALLDGETELDKQGLSSEKKARYYPQPKTRQGWKKNRRPDNALPLASPLAKKMRQPRFVKEEAQKPNPLPESVKEVPIIALVAPEPAAIPDPVCDSIVIEGMQFVLVGTATLPTGNVQKIYRAA